MLSRYARAMKDIRYIIEFRQPSTGSKVGAGALSTILAIAGELPRTLIDPVDQNGVPVLGTWHLLEATEDSHRAVYQLA